MSHPSASPYLCDLCGLTDTGPQRAYTLLVRLHDLYDMHGIFAPGFPGLLETFYVQERMLESIMPDVYDAFVRASRRNVLYRTSLTP